MTLLDLLKLMKRNIWLVVGLPVACAVICAIAVSFMPPKYEATATITASAELSSIASFAERAAQEQGGNDTTVEVTTNSSSKTIAVKATSSDPKAAKTAANIAATNTMFKAQERYNFLKSTNMAVSMVQATKITDDSPSLVKYSLIALLAGLFVAVCIVVIVDMARGRIHTAKDIEEDSNIRLLGYIGSSSSKKNGEGKKDANDVGASGSIVDPVASERLLANIRFASGENSSMSVVGTEDDGMLSVQTCKELAQAAAAANMEVLIVNADLRGSSIMDEVLDFQESNAKGLSDVLSGAEDISAVTEDISANIDYIPAGMQLANPVALLDSPVLKELLAQVQTEYDMVLVNTATPVKHADYTYVANASSSTVLCIQEFKTTRPTLEMIASQLSIADANVIGFVALK